MTPFPSLTIALGIIGVLLLLHVNFSVAVALDAQDDVQLYPDEENLSDSQKRQTLDEARLQRDNIYRLQEMYASSKRHKQALPEGYFTSVGAHFSNGPQDGLFDAAAFRRDSHRKFDALLATATKDISCPLPDKCAPHGYCMQDFGCDCHADDLNGYWRGTTCDECDFGYAGVNCTLQCPGGACNPCNSNGQCNQGSTGDGVCTCYSDASRGFWGPPDCSECAENYYGAECKLGCPGVESGLICSGQGYCLDGTGGSGTCVCFLGYDNATDCETCDGSHYGETCENACDGYVAATNEPCSGHGTCFSGFDGNGVCSCNQGWAGLLCNSQCPGTNGDCHGHGVCHDGLLGNGTCSCTGNFAAPNCSVCIPEFTGTSCNVSCAEKRQTASGEVCSGRGICATTDQVIAFCECAAGYAGGLCQDACGGSPPCSGHGSCAYVASTTTACNCSTGWGGSGGQCESCTDEFANSTDCATPCPSVGGRICNGRGTCIAGVCYCYGFTSCGPACDRFDLCTPCSSDFVYGTNCSTPCPGVGPPGSVTYQYACSGHGLCGHDRDMSLPTTGKCGCTFGWVGAACNLTCPSAVVAGMGTLVCSGISRGVCVADGVNSAVCSCREGFAGAACNVTCPHFDGKVCGGHGKCNAVTGECECEQRWTGSSCIVPCLCNTKHGKCNSSCADFKATDVCTACDCDGNFTDLCYTCKNGTQGTTCQGACVEGFTYATICNCSDYYGTASCSVKCPFRYNSSANATTACGGRGFCSAGRLGDGLCHCYSGFYGLACETQCSAANCSAILGKGQCNSSTGDCECQDDLEGHWKLGTSGNCDTCMDGFWGPACTEACSCNNHGTCDQNTGECSCYQDPIKGYYAGTLCETCAVGYLGASCSTESVLVSQLTRNIFFLDGSAASGSIFKPPPGYTSTSPVTPVLLVDDMEQLRHVVVGGFPTVLVDCTNTTTTDASLLVLNTSSEVPQLFGTCGESALVWKHLTKYFFLLQPVPTIAASICGGSVSARVVAMSASLRYNESWSPMGTFLSMDGLGTSLPEGGSAIASMPLRVRVATSQSNTLVPDDKKLFNAAANFVLLVLSRANFSSDSSLVEWYSGGTLVFAEFDPSSNAVSLYGGIALPSAFHATSITVSPYESVAKVGLQRVAISGYNDVPVGNTTQRVWEVLETNIDTLRNNLNSSSFGLTALASQVGSTCWPEFPSETSGVTFTLATSNECSYCKEASKVQFYDSNTLLVAFRVEDSISGVADTIVMSLWNTTSILATQSLSTVCPSSATRVAYASRALVGDSRPTAMAIDYFAGMVFVSSEMVSGDPSILTKFIISATASVFTKSALILNSVFDFASLFKSETVNQAEVIASLVVAPGSRLLYASSSSIPQIKIATFLLYEIVSIEPKIASVYGTIITLHGRGFKPSVNGGGLPTCFFDNASTPATIISATQAVCVVSNVSVTEASCQGQQVELSLFNPSIGVTTNLLTVQRAKVPSITEVSPNRGNFSERRLTITGVDFVESTTAFCRFTQFTSTNIIASYTYARASFVTPSEMHCTQPAVSVLNVTHLDITLDGQVYSPAVSYVICGPASRIRSSSDAAVTVVSSASWVSFAVNILTVDETGNELGDLDLVSRSIVAPVSVQDPAEQEVSFYTFPSCVPAERALWRSAGDGYPFPPCRDITISNQSRTATLSTQTPVPYLYALSNTSYGGILAFNETSLKGNARFKLFIFEPRAGAFSIRFIAAQTTWATSVFVIIVAGDPYALLIQNRGQRFGSDYLVIPAKETSLAEIDIVVVDRFANVVEGDSAANIEVQADVYSYLFNCTYTKPTTTVFYAPCQVHRGTITAKFSRSSGVVPFKDNIFLSNSVHGAYYYIMFQSSTANVDLVPVVTPPFQTDVCSGTQYKVPNTTTCSQCPSPGGRCDGTEVIQVDAGYWRAPTVATKIYACDKLSIVCNGSKGTWGATCGEGAAGVLCSGCISIENDDGSITYYGKSKLTDCEKCEDQVVNDLLFGVLAIAVFVVVVIWSFCTLRTEQQTDVSVVFRTVVNHLQATGELGQLSTKAGPFLKGIFSVSGGASTISVRAIQFLDCFQKQHELPFEYFFYGIMCLPVLALPVALGVFAIIRALNLTPLLNAELRKEIDLQEQQLGPSGAFVSLKRRYPLFMVVATTFSVILFTVYQTLIAQATSVLLCTEIVVGESFNSSTPAQSKWFLDDDMTIECDSNGISPLFLPGQLFAIGYGFGIPLTFIFGYRFINGRLGMPALTNVIFMFLSGGYKANYWFWQALIMIRKLLLVLARVFILDEQVQSAAGMWIMSIALALQLWLCPNEKDDHNKVEAGSLAVITLTLNLGLIYFWPGTSNSAEVALNIILVFVTFAGMVMLLVYLIPAALALVKELAQDIRDAIAGVKKEQNKLKDRRKKERQRRAMLLHRFPIDLEEDSSPLGGTEMDMTASVTFSAAASHSGGGAVGSGGGSAAATWNVSRLGPHARGNGEPEYDFDEMDAHTMLSLYDPDEEEDEEEMCDVEFEETFPDETVKDELLYNR